MAAFPDCIVQYSCCGTLSVEIKCPYRLSQNNSFNHQLNIRDMAGLNDPFIHFDGQNVSMNKSHKYYYQVQGQIFITQAKYGIFMVWSKHQKIIINVPRDENLWDHCLSRSRLYFHNIIIPELLANYYTAKL